MERRHPSAGFVFHDPGVSPRPRSPPTTEQAAGSATSSPPRSAATTPTPATTNNNNKRSRVDAFGSADDYEEVCSLGKGAFAAVAKARHRVTGETVAIKRLTVTETDPDPDGGGGVSDPEEELLREARLHGACGAHPFIVGVHGLVRDPATAELRLVMECVGGPSVKKFLRCQRQRRRSRRRGGRGLPLLPETTVRTVMWQLLTGAAKMHAEGVVHRDIKPENILITGDGKAVKICDFGLAVSISDSASASSACEPDGTLWYMAPEVLLEKPECGRNAAVDSWALGCVMAELINGEVLFEDGRDEDGQACTIFDVLGYPDDSTWPWFSSAPFAAETLPIVDNVHHDNRLRKMFPEAVLSQQGFEVLDGLLTCNPDKRLTAAAALRHPWFAKVDAMELLRNEELESASAALPKKQMLVGPLLQRCV